MGKNASFHFGVIILLVLLSLLGTSSIWGQNASKGTVKSHYMSVLRQIDRVKPDFHYRYELKRSKFISVEINSQEAFDNIINTLCLLEKTKNNIRIVIEDGEYFIKSPLNVGLLNNPKLRIEFVANGDVRFLGDALVFSKKGAISHNATHLVYDFVLNGFNVESAIFSDGRNTLFLNDTGRKNTKGCHTFSSAITKDSHLSTSSYDVWKATLPSALTYLNGLTQDELKNARISFTCASQNHIREIIKIQENAIWFKEPVGTKRVNGDYGEYKEYSRFFIYNVPYDLSPGFISVYGDRLYVPKGIERIYVHTYGGPFIRINDTGYKGLSISFKGIRFVGFNGALIHRVDKVQFADCVFEGVSSLGRVGGYSDIKGCRINNIMSSGLELRGDHCHFINNKVSNLLLRQNGTCVGITASAGQRIYIGHNVFENCGGAVVRSVSSVEGVTAKKYKRYSTIVEYNEFYYTQDGLPERYSRNDHGVIYLPTNPNNAIIRHNIIHDVPRMIGIYMDEGAQNVKCYKNLLYNIKDDYAICMARWKDTAVHTFDTKTGNNITYGNALGLNNVIMCNIIVGPIWAQGGRVLSDVASEEGEERTKWIKWYPNDIRKKNNGCVFSGNVQIQTSNSRERENIIKDIAYYDESLVVEGANMNDDKLLINASVNTLDLSSFVKERIAY